MPRKNRRSRNSTKRRTIRRNTRTSKNSRRLRNTRRSTNTRRSRSYKKNLKKLTKTKKRDERNRIIIVGGSKEGKGEEGGEQREEVTDYAPARSGPKLPTWITGTLQTLGTIIQNPELTPDLLKQPSFIFLRDVVSATMKYADIPEEEIFTKDLHEKINAIEGNKETAVEVKRKTMLDYLNILKEFIEKNLGYNIDVDPEKIIAGSEPEKTNFLLQKLYEVVVRLKPQVQEEAESQQRTYLVQNKEGEEEAETPQESMDQLITALRKQQQKTQKEKEGQAKRSLEERELLEQILSNSEKCEMYLLEGLKGLEKP